MHGCVREETGEFVGGADIVTEMFQAGELQKQFEDSGIAVKQTA